MPLKNSSEKGTRTKYPNTTPEMKDVNAKKTKGKANLFSLIFNPGTTNFQNWYIKYGNAMIKPEAKDMNHLMRNILCTCKDCITMGLLVMVLGYNRILNISSM